MFLTGRLSLTNRKFNIEKSLKKVEKYINAIKQKYPVVGLASVFHVDGPQVLNDLNIRMVTELVKLAEQIGRFEFSNEKIAGNGNAGGIKETFEALLQEERDFDDNEAKETGMKENKEKTDDENEKGKDTDKPTDNQQNEGADASTRTAQNIHTVAIDHLAASILVELKEYIDFFTVQFEKDLNIVAAKKNISVERCNKKYIGTKKDGNRLKELTYIEILPLLTEASLIVFTKYRTLTRNLSSKFFNHSILPCIVSYLLSMSATSVNCERSFSDLNERIGTKRYNLSNLSLHSGLLISAATSALKIDT